MNDLTNKPQAHHSINEVVLYWRFIKVSIKAQLQYKVSFAINLISQILFMSIELLAIWSLFTRFGSLPDWTFQEVCIFYGIVHVSFSIAELMNAGFDRFGTWYIKTGDFDRVLLRPRSIFVQLAGRELSLRRLGKLGQGIAVFIWGWVSLGLSFEITTYGFLLVVIFCGACLFLALFILQATLSFWTVESLELMNIVTYGGVESSQYPLAIYEEWFRNVFTFVIPIACVFYYPILAILGKNDPLGSELWFQWCAPVVGFLFFIFSMWCFLRVGVRRYTSTGS